jgi:hypothetical protein
LREIPTSEIKGIKQTDLDETLYTAADTCEISLNPDRL